MGEQSGDEPGRGPTEPVEHLGAVRVLNWSARALTCLHLDEAEATLTIRGVLRSYVYRRDRNQSTPRSRSENISTTGINPSNVMDVFERAKRRGK
jgi:hypothetical protein